MLNANPVYRKTTSQAITFTSYNESKLYNWTPFTLPPRSVPFFLLKFAPIESPRRDERGIAVRLLWAYLQVRVFRTKANESAKFHPRDSRCDALKHFIIPALSTEATSEQRITVHYWEFKCDLGASKHLLKRPGYPLEAPLNPQNGVSSDICVLGLAIMLQLDTYLYSLVVRW